MTQDSYFRGYHAIKEVIDYMQPLAVWMEANKPTNKSLTLKGQDFDLLKRWPKAASLFEVWQSPAGEMVYRGFALKRDKKPARYPARGEAGAQA